MRAVDNKRRAKAVEANKGKKKKRGSVFLGEVGLCFTLGYIYIYIYHTISYVICAACMSKLQNSEKIRKNMYVRIGTSDTLNSEYF